jgi:hypothetical protein
VNLLDKRFTVRGAILRAAMKKALDISIPDEIPVLCVKQNNKIA